jgi:hypothetical protein
MTNYLTRERLYSHLTLVTTLTCPSTNHSRREHYAQTLLKSRGKPFTYREPLKDCYTKKSLKRALLSSAQPASAKSKWSFLLLARVITNNDDHDGDNCNVYKSWYMACNDCLVHKTMANCNLDPIYSKLNP